MSTSEQIDYINIEITACTERTAQAIASSSVDRAIAAGKDADEVLPTVGTANWLYNHTVIHSGLVQLKVETVVSSLGFAETSRSSYVTSAPASRLTAGVARVKKEKAARKSK